MNPKPKRQWDHPVLLGAEGRRERQREEMRDLAWSERRGSLREQAVLFLLALLLWPVPLLNPVKLMVVVFHELSHVAAAYATGGTVFGIAIDPAGAGATLGIGGHLPTIVAAGYVGSLAVGLLLYWLLTRWDEGEVWILLCGLCCISLAFGWLNDFTALFGYGTLFLMGLGALWLGPGVKRLVLRWVAVTCCLYPVIDVVSELWMESSGLELNGQAVASDVARLAVLSGLPAGLIAAFWGVIGVWVAVKMPLWSAARDAEGEVRRSLINREPNDPDLQYYGNDPYNQARYRIR